MTKQSSFFALKVEDEWIFFTYPPFVFMSGGGSAEAINKTARDDSGDEAEISTAVTGAGNIYHSIFIYYSIYHLHIYLTIFQYIYLSTYPSVNLSFDTLLP